MKGTRLINDFSFECTELVGMEVEAFYGFYEEGNPQNIGMIIVKLKEQDLWQRLFLQAGLGFWGEYDQEAAFCDYDGDPFVDFGTVLKLKGQLVKKIACIGVDNQNSSMLFEIGNRHLMYQYTDPHDMFSDTSIITNHLDGVINDV